MKKIITALFVVAAAMASNAAAYTWKTAAANQVYNQNTVDKLASGTAYLFDSTTLTQAALLTAIVDGSSLASLGYIDMATISDGAIAAGTAIEAGATLSAYFAVLNDAGDVFISDIATAIGLDVGSVGMSFKAKTASQAMAKDASAGYKGAGWYTQSVPEPTSGLLMLLGMAGLALRRRRA